MEKLSDHITEALSEWCARLAGIQHYKLFRNKIVKEDMYLCHFDKHQLTVHYKAGS
jgi:hypothetical protein